MPRYNKNGIKELRELLYNSCIHDAKLERVSYDRGENSLRIETFNPIFNVSINLTFCDVGIALAIRGNDDFGSHETIISLTAEEDFSSLHSFIQKYNKSADDSLYLLFQMFSGDEFHIVSREVIVEIAR